MTKGKTDYFKTLSELAKTLLDGALLLEAALGSFQPGTCERAAAALDGLRHKARFQRKSLRAGLYADFITPIERADLLALADALCFADDCLFSICARLYQFKISKIGPETVSLCHTLRAVCSELHALFAGLRDYKNPPRLLPHIDAVLGLTAKVCPQDCAGLVLSANPLQTVLWLQIWDRFEEAFAACRAAAERVDGILAQNG